MVAWIWLLGVFIALLVLDAFLGGFTGGLVGLLFWLASRRRPWEKAIPFDVLLGAAGFVVVEMGALALGQMREYIPTYLGPAFVEPIKSLYEHNFRAGFVAAVITPILYEAYRARPGVR
jgi:hypothetical protein